MKQTSFRSLVITGEQIRAARALARIEQSELARRSSVSLETVKRLERIRGPVDANIRTLTAIGEAFQLIGIAFDSADDRGVGVRITGVGGPPEIHRPVDKGNGSAVVSQVHRLIYWSRVTPAEADRIGSILDDIRVVGAARNAALSVSGLLLAHDGYFIQVLEGAKDAVRGIYGSISTDPRHTGLHLIQCRPITGRHFGVPGLRAVNLADHRGALLDEPWMMNGLQPDMLTPASALGFLSVVQDLQGEI